MAHERDRVQEEGEELSVALLEAVRRQVDAEQRLSERLPEHAGEWVAVRDHEVVAHAATLHELMAEVDDADVEAVFKVVKEQGTACFF
jgi:hypothetical protein